MFSERSNWDLSPNPLSTLLHDKKSRGEKVVDLTASNPTRIGLNYDAEEILSALQHPRSLVYDPDPRGMATTREAVAGYYRDRGERLGSDSIFLTPGSSEAYAILFKLLGNPGDEILIPRPGYPLLSYLTSFEGLTPVSYPLNYDTAKGWSIDLDVLSALVTPSTRAIVMVNPNNPTGSYLKQHELADLNQICRQNELALIVDEVFFDFCATEAHRPDRVTVNDSKALTFVLNGLSKLVGLPQMKLGWIGITGDPALGAAAGARLEMMLDFYLSVATPVQLAAPKLLLQLKKIQRQLFSRITENCQVLEERFAKISNIHPLIREGGWYAVLRIYDDVSDEDRVFRLLKDDNTLVHPGYFYDFQTEGFLVLSLLPPQNIFSKGISCLIERYGRD